MLKRSKKEKIIETAKEMFLKFKFSSVTIDEISRNIGISKKTVYKYFPSKKQILYSVVKTLMSTIDSQARKILLDREMDYFQKLKKMMKFTGRQASYLSTPFVKEIKKKFPDLWDEIMKFRKEKVRTYMLILLEEGVEKGFFSPDFDKELFIHLYINLATVSIDPDFLSETTLTASDVFEEIIFVIFNGIFTEKGRKFSKELFEEKS
mgnify:CR=1 FL=1